MSAAASARALPALILGATLIGLAPIFVREAQLGPTAVAFWRLALATPLLGLWLWRARATVLPGRGWPWGLWLGGAFFAGDLAVWHHSLHWTSVANSTLLTNLAPVWVTLVAGLVFGERIGRIFVVGLCATLTGAGVLMADSVRISARTLAGDGLAIVTSLFYAGYLLVLSRSRAQYPTAAVMFWTTSAAALCTLPLVGLAGETLWPATAADWGLLAGLALLSHVGGQGLIAYGFAHLPASFSAVSLLVQPLAAAVFAWLLLDEPFGGQQALGGAIVLAGILLCRHALRRD
ncbi:Permease of the drug/metabolite transporter (DMT) superfamily [Fontimonas thermophila]|uniref:Permease of the drug/metabolite transporter (DMT) superfamily n=1 Tax=Fontimonas thermophila TaxID=1076937 RepID=A0A1I2H920_9GAMM|nr:DMT family transporter [Fontimonas thermophila]SFF25959.1 Permease of the drug/metabolite transporter (DMT) superfamily [Fontimonas thermophila]